MSDFDYSLHYERFHDGSPEHTLRMAAWIGSLLGPHLPEDKDAPLIDVGCGYGFALTALRSLGYRNIRGVEVSAQQAERCRRSGFDVEVTDDTEAWLQAHRESFAFVVLMDVLEHVRVSDQIRFCRSIHNALRPGGRVFVTTPNANSWLATRWRYIDYTHHSSFTEHSLHFALRNAGFYEIALDNSKGLGPMPKTLWRREGRERFRKWCVRWLLLQIFRAELPSENMRSISFELNLQALATKGSDDSQRP